MDIDESSGIDSSDWWLCSGPRSPQSLAERAALGGPLFDRGPLWAGPGSTLRLRDCGKARQDGELVRMRDRAQPEHARLQSALLPQHPQKGLCVLQGDGGPAPGAWRVRFWDRKADGEGGVQRGPQPEALPLGPQELRGSPQAGGDAVVEGLFPASSSGLVLVF